MPTNYEPSDEIRVFGGGEDDEDVEGSRLPLLIVIALLVLAAFGGVVWLAYQRGVQQGHSEMPRVIAAEPGPVKVAPNSAGGTATPYTGLKIYQQPAPSSDEPGTATPQPARAATKPVPTTTPATHPMASATPVPPVATKPAPATSAPAPLTKPAPVHAAEVAPIRPSVTSAPESAAPAATPTAAGSGILQIGSYKSEADAGAAWIAYKAKHSTLLAGMTVDVKQVDLGAKGTWYRLRIVAADKSAAIALCDKLKAEGAACIPAR